MNEEQLKAFMHAVEEMRRLQKLYFEKRLPGDLTRAKGWEREVDKLIKKYHEQERPPEAVQ